ncbi:hypothetical protein ACIRYZ_42370 [Kitasatospora sp. NPDC101155]|uniref:hypothetical protein n=1 Tax=Kitasatospora sp. NPDC101155 TaxID=3364097 RepID=UPI0038133F37
MPVVLRAASAPSVRPAPALSGPSAPASAQPGSSAPGTARLLQRVAEQAGLIGVPLTAVPARGPSTVQAAPATGSPSRAVSPPVTSSAAKTVGGSPAETGGSGPADLDELARRLVEPVGRLLRTELRRGRERGGKPYDLRR